MGSDMEEEGAKPELRLIGEKIAKRLEVSVNILTLQSKQYNISKVRKEACRPSKLNKKD